MTADKAGNCSNLFLSSLISFSRASFCFSRSAFETPSNLAISFSITSNSFSLGSICELCMTADRAGNCSTLFLSSLISFRGRIYSLQDFSTFRFCFSSHVPRTNHEVFGSVYPNRKPTNQPFACNKFQSRSLENFQGSFDGSKLIQKNRLFLARV